MQFVISLECKADHNVCHKLALFTMMNIEVPTMKFEKTTPYFGMHAKCLILERDEINAILFKILLFINCSSLLVIWFIKFAPNE